MLLEQLAVWKSRNPATSLAASAWEVPRPAAALTSWPMLQKQRRTRHQEQVRLIQAMLNTALQPANRKSRQIVVLGIAASDNKRHATTRVNTLRIADTADVYFYEGW
ncbi:hypothetical protein [Pseudomonas sp. TE3610]